MFGYTLAEVTIVTIDPGLKIFKVVLLIDGVETEVMFVETTSHVAAARIVRSALIDGKSYEREKWRLEISERGRGGAIPVRRRP
jgi:hypothetical protein